MSLRKKYLWVPIGDAQESQGRAGGLAAALLPLLQRADVDAEQRSKLGLAHAEPPANLCWWGYS
jgi:hypothetical protein